MLSFVKFDHTPNKNRTQFISFIIKSTIIIILLKRYIKINNFYPSNYIIANNVLSLTIKYLFYFTKTFQLKKAENRF